MENNAAVGLYVGDMLLATSTDSQVVAAAARSLLADSPAPSTTDALGLARHAALERLAKGTG